MKKLLVILVSLAFISCNNEGDKTKATGDSSGAMKTATTDPESKPESSGTGCSSFIWFKKGTSFQYSVKDGKGKEMASTTTVINDVHDEGGALVADYTTTFADGKKIDASYKCEGDKLYMNMKSLLSSSLMQQKGMEMEVKDAFVSFPWNMKEGDHLDDGVFEIVTKREGKEFMSMKMVTSDRLVAGSEKVTTPGGTWDCLKITENITSTATMMGKQLSSNKSKSTQWFAPVAGLVKFETSDASGNIVSSSELTSVKN